MNLTGAGVEVRRHLNAAPERVFAAFAEPALVPRWLTPSPEVRLTLLAFDFREGGAYRFAYDVPDGRRMIVNGTFHAIARPNRNAFSWLIEPPDEHAGIPSEVTVTIQPSATGGSDLVIRHDKFGRADADARHDQGWRGALDQLAALLARTESTDERRPT
jgi:uncharacterized protein YndB with AHSA1/START domain